MKNIFDDTEIAYRYTREQAIEDGVIVDLTNNSLVKEAGLKIPVAVTSGVFNLLQPPKELEIYQDFNGRLWDLLTLAKLEVKRIIKQEDWFGTFKVIFQVSPGKKELKEFFITFNELEGFTIMLPSEY